MKYSKQKIDERKIAEAAVRLSEELLNSYIDSAGDAIYILETPTGRIRKCNARACCDLGYGEKELLKLSAKDIEANLPSKEITEIHGQLRPGEATTIEGAHKRKDGTVFPVEIRLSSLAPAQPELMIAIARDVTDRKRAEGVLRESEKKLREVQEMAHLGFWNWDVKTGEVEWSEEVFRIFCLDPKTFTPQINSILALSPWPEDHERDQELIKRAIESHSPGSYEQKFLRPDQSIGYYYSTFQGTYDEKGELLSIVGTVLDITARTRAEEALRISEENYRHLFNNAIEGVYRTTSDGKLVGVNAAFVRMFGYESSEEMLAAVTDIAHQLYVNPDDRINAISALQKRGYLKDFEIQMRKKDGSKIWTSLNARLNKSPRGDSFEGFITDITERRNVEDALVLNSKRMQVMLQLNQLAEAEVKEITDFALEEAVKMTRSKIGYLAFLNEDESVLTMHSWSKSAMAECAIDEKPLLYPVETSGLLGAAVRQRQPVITNNYAASNPLKKGLPPGHVIINRHMNIPVFVGSRIVLVAGVGNKAVDYDQNDVEQLIVLMEGMWRLIERKRAKEALTESRDLLANLARLVPGVIYQYRLYPDGRSAFPYASSGMNDIYEVTPEEVREDATPVFGRLHPDDYNNVANAIQESARTLQEFYCEFRVNLPRQGLRWRWCQAHPERTADGGTLWHGIISDITERKLADEKILRQLKELERWQDVTLGREDRVRQLKHEVNELVIRLGETIRYPSQDNDGNKTMTPSEGLED